MITRAPVADPTVQFAADVQYYLALSPRQLPSRYFYDDLGSALFDAICALPWYGITRAETRSPFVTSTRKRKCRLSSARAAAESANAGQCRAERTIAGASTASTVTP